MFGKHSNPLDGLPGEMRWKGSEASRHCRSRSRGSGSDAFHYVLSKAAYPVSGMDPVVLCVPHLSYLVAKDLVVEFGKE